MSQIIRHEIGRNNLPSLTEEQRAKLKALAEMPDNVIDYNDIAPLDEAFWKSAVRLSACPAT